MLPLGKGIHGLGNNIKVNITIADSEDFNYFEMAQDRAIWWSVVKMVSDLRMNNIRQSL
jgi:hypothetical protein